MGRSGRCGEMRALVLACLVLHALAVTTNEPGVEELVDISAPGKGGKLAALDAAASHDIVHPGDGTQTGRAGALPTRAAPSGQGPLPNFPGTPYGKPGYKESHNWQTDIDLLMPGVFNTKFYAAKYGLKDKTEAEVKAEWVAKAGTTKIPNCQQGNAAFNLNTYVKNNPSVADGFNGFSCKAALENYLRAGIFDGLDGRVGYAIKNSKNKPEFALSEKQTTPADFKIQAARSYTYTFWIQVSDMMSPMSNIMHYSNKDYPRTPALFLKPATTNLQFKVSQTNDPDFGCDADAKAPGVLSLGKWHMLALVVKENAIALHVDGEKKCEKTNAAGGATMPPADSKLYLSNPWAPPSRAKIRSMNYYPNAAFTVDEIKAQMAAEEEEEAQGA